MVVLHLISISETLFRLASDASGHCKSSGSVDTEEASAMEDVLPSLPVRISFLMLNRCARRDYTQPPVFIIRTSSWREIDRQNAQAGPCAQWLCVRRTQEIACHRKLSIQDSQDATSCNSRRSVISNPTDAKTCGIRTIHLAKHTKKDLCGHQPYDNGFLTAIVIYNLTDSLESHLQPHKYTVIHIVWTAQHRAIAYSQVSALPFGI
jgi:hypothetical protein